MSIFSGDEVKRRVDLLMKEWPHPEADSVYLHQDIAHVAECKYGSARYRSVIASWKRRLMKELNIDIDSVVGHGYRVLTENERVAVGIKDFGLARRSMGRSVNRIERAETGKLDDHHRKQQDHAKRLRELVDSGRKAEKSIAIVGKVVALPRRTGTEQ